MLSISRQELLAKLEGTQDAALVEVLPKVAYHAGHLPTAISVPFDDAFDETVKAALPDRARPIVVYGSGRENSVSRAAAFRMEELGYARVMEYSGGKLQWMESGGRLE